MTDIEVDTIPLSQAQIEIINHINELRVPEPQKLNLSALKCKRCRRTIISTEDFVDHNKGQGQTAFTFKKRDSSSSIKCSSYFVEPLGWILDEVQEGELEGKIKCPKCQAKLGNFSWAGMQCSCGSWVTPSFAIHREKVDEVLT
ncbi:15108_t:CDS:2 [Funneliformis geosporum]|uniref:protein-tyrosine-phosphatase n=1 Tax=Funneliformis geosporum TaxID=1117311 RepID=A0A9W4WZ60_9GLOM|nr:15108_t:CDS:2 [Funneliformis geosporum]